VNHTASCKNTKNFLLNKSNASKGFNWPDKNTYPGGCKDEPTIITVSKDDTFDRFGHEGGKFGSPMTDTTYSYVSRALPYIRRENNSKKNCGNVYENETTTTKNYHVYKVLKDIPNVKQCSAVGAFNKPGEAVQWEFHTAIWQMKAAGEIEEISYTSLPKFM